MTRYSFFMVIGTIILGLIMAFCGLITASVMSYLGYPTSVLKGLIYWMAILGLRETCIHLHNCSIGYANGAFDED